MDELKFVLRCFGFAALLLLLTQLKTGNITIEQRIQGSLTNSRTAEFVNKVADGGVKLIQDTAVLAKATYEDWKKSAPVSSAAPAEAGLTSGVLAQARAFQEEHLKKQQPGSSDETELIEEETY